VVIPHRSMSIVCQSLRNYLLVSLAAIALPAVNFATPQAIAQTLPRPDFQRPTIQPPTVPLPILPPPAEIIPTPSNRQPASPPADLTTQIVVKKFEISGSTVFTSAELAQITNRWTDRPINFSQLWQLANEITQLYVSNGYVSSGAFIPGNQTFDVRGGVVKIQIIEGSVEDIVVTGTQRLSPNYIKSRIALGANQPLKIDRLIESLRLLQLDPLIKSISTELAVGKEPGTSIIQLRVAENPHWRSSINIANNRTPSVGEIQAQFAGSHSNLTGAGDSLAVAYGKSEASNVLDLNYTLPLNPRNGTLKLQYSRSDSRVIESPFDQLDINGTAQDISVSYRQPLLQTTAQELAIGVTLAHRETNTGYLLAIVGERVAYPAPGADQNGTTRITAARFFQDYTSRDTQQVFAARSQLSIGINALGATFTASSPHSNFVTWRGQAQYVRALAPNSILLLKVEGQLADRSLLALEQIGFGGQDTVRGYRQDLLLGDNGLLASAEARFPIFTPPGSSQILQIVPFLDLGTAWNHPPNPSLKPNTIAAVGIGLRYQDGDNFFAKFDYGIPFTQIEQAKRTGQERGFYFSLGYSRSF
jgi:hemolysin activation/secretion protein